jgi:hypothetical protein
MGIQSMGWEIRSGPYADNAGERKKKREQRLRQLIASLQSGSLDAARVAFSAVVSHDEDMANNRHMTHIGAALQSSNLPGAWRCAQELRPAYPWAFQAPPKHLSHPPSVTAQPQEARSFTDGLTGRLFDLIA